MTFALKLFLGLLTQATHTQVRTSSENQFFCWQIFFLIGDNGGSAAAVIYVSTGVQTFAFSDDRQWRNVRR